MFFEKTESAFVFEPRTEFMTSQNSEVDSYNLYTYDDEGRLSMIKHYFFNETGKAFEFRSMYTLEYNGGFISKVNLKLPNTMYMLTIKMGMLSVINISPILFLKTH